MFYGLILKPGIPVSVGTDLGEVLHISQACLNAPKGSGNTYVKIKDGQSTFAVCCLQKDTQEHASLDLFVQSESSPSFVAEGPNEVHLLGYWEPNPSLSDDEDDGMSGLMGDEGVSESDEENAEEMESFAKKLPSIEELGDDESDEDDEEEDDEPVEAAKPKALPAGGASANKQKPGQKDGDKPQQQNKSQVPQPKAKAGPKASPKANEVQQGQKRKAADGPATEPSAKRAISATPAKVEGGGEEKFKADLTEYLSKDGRPCMSEMGSKVKKPAGVAKKIGVFLKERKDVFKIEGNNVELLK